MLSSFFLLSGIFALGLASLDLRGPEEKIQADIPDQKTLILIDSSMSMYVEDVRPNRFKKALLLARHFIRNSAGHQISLGVFSDTQKQIVPFTDDVDLLEARLRAIEEMNVRGGGSNIHQALAEAIQYFKTTDSTDLPSGNIILMTDGEENAGPFDIQGSDKMTLVVMAIGTLKGGKIPVRNDEGTFLDYKKYQGQDVVSALNEESIKKMGPKFKNFKYWIVQSNYLPTPEIIKYLRDHFKKSLIRSETTIRPVKGFELLKVASIFLSLSYLLFNFKSFVVTCFLFVMLGLAVNPSFANEVESIDNEKMDKKPDKETLQLESKMQEGKLLDEGRLKLAQKYLELGQSEKSATLFKENETTDSYQNNLSAQFNHATALAQKPDTYALAVQKYLDLYNNVDDETLKESIRKNLKILSQKQMQQQKEENKKEQDKNKDQNKDQQKDQNKDQNKDQSKDQSKGDQDKEQDKEQENDQNQSQNQSKDQKDNQKQNKDNDNKEQQQDQKNEQDNKDAQNKKNDKQNEKKSEEDLKNQEQKAKDEQPNKGEKEKQSKDKNGQKQSKNLEEKEKEIEQKRKMVKITPILKKILNEDRELQEKLLDTKTDERTKREQKDW